MSTENGPKIYSTHEAARLMGVEMTTVIGWCKQGKLAAYTTPGKHRRIKADDLLTFLRKYDMPIPSALMAPSGCVIVDDDPGMRSLLKRLIHDIDPKTVADEARDGFEAGQKIVDLKPAVVVLDLNLPGVDGFRVCEMIRKDPRLQHTKILAISGDAEFEKKILAAGADDFAAKPFQMESLRKKIRRLIA
jgi:excisionase family DNA binding protein